MTVNASVGVNDTRLAAAGLATFYPVMPDADWVARAAQCGAGVVQLRYKSSNAAAIERQIADSLASCARFGCQLIVNDHWQAAIKLGATMVHLGQEDLAAADLAALTDAGVRFGISTHDDSELEIALGAAPAYVALGPIYETKLKKMKWQPQGLQRISQWKERIGSRPLVAIGGLTPERARDAMTAGADSVAVVTDVVTHADPDARIAEWLALCATV